MAFGGRLPELNPGQVHQIFIQHIKRRHKYSKRETHEKHVQIECFSALTPTPSEKHG